MENTVYWNHNVDLKSTEFLTLPLISLEQHLKSKEKEKKDNNLMHGYLACPAAKQTLKNTFVVKAGFDITLSFEDNSYSIDTKKVKDPQVKSEFLNKFFMCRSFKDKLVTFTHNTLLFCEKNINAIQMHPFLEDSEYARNTGQIVGEYNISKWYRPIQPTFYCYKDKIEIKEGDVLFYLMFRSEDDVKLKEYEMTSKMERAIYSNTSLKEYKAMKTMKYLYELFTLRKLDKKLLKEIKNNLVE
jgi:hypothetical protein